MLSDGAIPVGPVEYWASLGDFAQTRSAIEDGHDVNATSTGGSTALHAAALNGHAEIVKLLINCGARIQSRLESGESAADLAKLTGNTEIAILLDA